MIIKYTSVLVCFGIIYTSLWGCGSAKHLVFFTNTSIGLEVSADTSNPTPRVIIGYKRQEGVLNPVYDEKKRTIIYCKEDGQPCKSIIEGELREESYSVIAKYQGGTSGGDAKMSNAQWFATGEAAKLLAKAPGIAGAVTGSSEIAAEAAKQTHLLLSDEISQEVKTSTFWVAMEMLEQIETERTRYLLKQINRYANKYKFQDFNHYRLGDESIVTFDSQGKKLNTGNWLIIKQYEDNLANSIKVLNSLLTNPAYKLKININADATRPDKKQMKNILEELRIQEELLKQFRQNLHKEESIVEAIKYVGKKLHGE